MFSVCGAGISYTISVRIYYCGDQVEQNLSLTGGMRNLLVRRPGGDKLLWTSDRFLRRLTFGFYLIVSIARTVESTSSDQITS
jgi:hypothetical protein